MQQRAGIEPGSELRLRLQLDELVSTMCKALNDPKRLMLLYSLRDGQRTVGELCQVLGAPQSNTSQHLAILRERGLVSTERRGSSVLYSLRYPELLDAVDLLRGIMAAEVDRQLQLRSMAPPDRADPRGPSGPRSPGHRQPG